MNSEVEWTTYPPDIYRVMAWLIPEPEGDYSVVSINLPGCATMGDTLDECLSNLKEAATGLIEAYLKDGQPIPWVTSGDMPPRPTPDTKRITVFVTVPPKEQPNAND